MNVALAKGLIASLCENGIREFVVCAGARNAPLIAVLGKCRGIQVYRFFEERSASFFALGRIKNHQQPVAVVTTSGTAVAECLPAVIEGYYSNLPLIVVSADRPQRYRGSGAPQTIEQAGLFGQYAERTYDIETISDLKLAIGQRPIQVNVAFTEPLVDEEIEIFKASSPKKITRKPALDPLTSEQEHQAREFLKKSQRPVVVLANISRQHKKTVVDWLSRVGLPTYAESGSHCRDDAALSASILQSGERILFHPEFMEKADSVIRIGGVPTTRFWRDLDEKFQCPVLSISDRPFSGLARSRAAPLPMDALSLMPIQSAKFAWTTSELQTVWDFDHKQSQRLDQLLTKYPKSEPALVRELAKIIPPGSRVYVGNSLPIRIWDLVAPFQFQDFDFEANRGVNGIDGQLSTFLGWSSKEVGNWGLFGDLTTLYDLPAPWALSQTKIPDVHLVVMNNGGGKIFAPMFKSADFENRHHLGFSNWAAMFGLSYVRVDHSSEMKELAVSSGAHPPQVIELKPDQKQSDRFWEAWNKAWSK